MGPQLVGHCQGNLKGPASHLHYPALTMTPSCSRGRLVVIVRAGEDADVGKGPLWSPWWETHSLALTRKSASESKPINRPLHCSFAYKYFSYSQR